MKSVRQLIDEISAESILVQDPNPKMREGDALLQKHMNEVAQKASELRKAGEQIHNTQHSQQIKDSEGGGYKSTLWHGFTPAPDRKTIIHTKKDGSVESRVEPVNQL